MKINKKYIAGFCLFFLVTLTGCIKTPVSSIEKELIWCGEKPCQQNTKSDSTVCDKPAGKYHQPCETNNDCPQNQGCQPTECYIDNTPTQLRVCL